MRGIYRYYGIVVAGVLLCASRGTTWAQNAAEKAAADAMFSEGKRLINKGDVAAACDKFEASLAKVVQLGTQIALASCYEKLGKTASALGEFRAAASAAAKLNDKRQRFAEEHAAALEPRLSKLAIIVISNRAEGLEIRCDGAEVQPAQLGVPVPVDPGEHTVEATAPDRKPWSIKVLVPTTPGVVDVPIPALEKDTARPPDPAFLVSNVLPQHDDPGTSHRQSHLLAYGIGGGGAAMIGVSLIFGTLANSKWSDARMHCHDNLCDATGVDLAGSAHTMGNLSTATFLVGLAGVAAGGILLFTTRTDHEPAPTGNASAFHVVPAISPSTLGVSLQGGF